MKIKKIPFLIIAVLLSFLVLGGCRQINQNELEGTAWLLTEMNGTQPISETELTIEFTEQEVSGSAGCNHFGGTYTIKSEKIQFDSVFNTEMACVERDGVMEQEQVYLEIIRSAVRFNQTEQELDIFDNADGILKFEPYNTNVADRTSGEQNEPVQIEAPTDAPDVDVLPAEGPSWDYNPYQDPDTGISVFVPKGWIVTGIVEGKQAILQSYPEDKYVGGESREEGDTKCDLSIQSIEVSTEELISQWKSSSTTTIVSEEPFRLNSGASGTRFEIESMGTSVSFVTELGGRVVVLTCFGDFSLVDEIAATLDYLD